jgi:hypothetical protein
MLAKVHSAAVLGIDSYPIEIEVNAGWGQPAVIIVGLPDAAVKESRDRVKTAIENSGFKYVMGRTTINLAPASCQASKKRRSQAGRRFPQSGRGTVSSCGSRGASWACGMAGVVLNPPEMGTILHWYVAVVFTLSLILPFLPRRNHQGWAKITWVLMCLMAITWAVLGIVYDVYYATLSKMVIRYLVHYKEVAGGLWGGLWIGLALSGQMFCMRAKQLQNGK